MDGRCYLCTQKTKYQDALLCTNCFCHFQSYQWLSCARCGYITCLGCENLSAFNKVTSAYTYKDVLANILILSKEDNNLNAQKVFNELFFIPVKNSLLKMILNENYDFIVVSPLRKERIFHGTWHPNIFYDEILQYIYLHELPENCRPQILYPYYAHKKKKQSLIPIDRREKLEKIGIELIYSNFIPDTLNENRKILLLDDVLTTGETSILCKTLSSQKISNAIWDLFTILRAPQS